MKTINRKSNQNIHDAKCCAYCIYFSEHSVKYGFCEKHSGTWIKITQICNLFIKIGESDKIPSHAPCPNCGSRRLYVPNLVEWEVYYHVACRDCLYTGPYREKRKKAWEAYDQERSKK